MWCLRIVSASTRFCDVGLVGNTGIPTHPPVAAVFQFAEDEQIVTIIVRMRKIDLNFKDPEPAAYCRPCCSTHSGKAEHRSVLRNAATKRAEAVGTVERECSFTSE